MTPTRVIAALLPLGKYAVLSLWEMHIRTAERLASMTLVIGQLLDNSRNPHAMQTRGKGWFEEQFRDTILPEAKSLGLKTTAMMAEQSYGNIAQLFESHHQMREAVLRIEQVMRAELSTVRFIHIPEEKLEYLNASTAFGTDSFRKFPSCQYDIEHAGKCLAIGANTACVTHLMRALEAPLIALANDLGIESKKEPWGALLNRIQDAIETSKKKDHDKQFLREAATSFDNIRVAWRNDAAHAKAIYDEEQASKIWGTTRDLIKHLATRFTEP